MGNQSRETKDARDLERLYDTKAYGTKHQTVLRLVRERGLEGAMAQLEAWGMVPMGGNTAEVIGKLEGGGHGR